MNTYKIKFYQLIGKSCEVEVEANSEDEAMDVFYDDLDVYESLSAILTKDVLETDIDEVICTYIDEEE